MPEIMTWQYIAGFFDGEGSLTHNGKGYRITIPQTHRRVLMNILDFVGGGTVFKVRKRRSHWKESWVFLIAKQEDVLTFIKSVLPFLIVKKKSAVRVLRRLVPNVMEKNRHDAERIKKHLTSVRMRKRGETYRTIGKAVGLDWSYVRRFLKKTAP